MVTKKKSIKVSIIIPAYNEEKVIGKLLLSIKKQSYHNIETIVVDDSSTDATVTVAKEYTKKVFARTHAERSVQRNFGARQAKGQYLLFLDADMYLPPKVIESCVKTIVNSDCGALIIPEETAGDTLVAKLRRFEREMYRKDPSIEVARFFEKKAFMEIGGYDEDLTGTEDYDLPKRFSQKHKIGWSRVALVHDERGLTFMKLLRKKYYYASKSAKYADKYPDLVRAQGTILFRVAYLRNWKKFVLNPFMGVLFIFTRSLTMLSAVAGYISAAGFKSFIKVFYRSFIKNEK